MNLSKIKIMKNEYMDEETPDETVTINDTVIDEINHYIYLSQLIALGSASKEQEIKCRITTDWQAFGRASTVLRGKNMPVVLKGRIYNQYIIPAVTYSHRNVESYNEANEIILNLPLDDDVCGGDDIMR